MSINLNKIYQYIKKETSHKASLEQVIFSFIFSFKKYFFLKELFPGMFIKLKDVSRLIGTVVLFHTG